MSPRRLCTCQYAFELVAPPQNKQVGYITMGPVLPPACHLLLQCVFLHIEDSLYSSPGIMSTYGHHSRHAFPFVATAATSYGEALNCRCAEGDCAT